MIQTTLDAGNRHDMESATALVHEDFVGVVPPTLSAEPGNYEGREGVVRYFDLWREIADDLVTSPVRYETEGEWTIVIAEVTGTGRSSGMPIRDDVYLGFLLRDGLIARIEAFP